MKIKTYLLLLAMLGLVLPARSALAAPLAEFSQSKAVESITLFLPGTSPYKTFTLTGPDRLVVDVPALEGKPTFALPPTYKGKLLKAARIGRFNPDTSRFVFDLKKPIAVIRVREEEKKKQPRLVIEIADAASKEASNAADDADDEKSEKSPAKKSGKKGAGKTKPEIPLIVIDPGHGGVDPGTIAADGTQEKDIVLEYGKALKARLQKSGRYRVKMTRDDDRFIMLRKRIAIARKEKASLFISLHADSAPESAARGLSVYTLSEKASDDEAEALAARENKADVLAGMDLSDERQDVADILISLAQRETNNNSVTFGDLLVIALEDKVRLLPNSHRFAGFAVLKAPDIPSVLVETGFLSHPGEGKLLRSKAHRDKVIAGIAAGVDSYFAHKKKAEGE